RGAALAQLRGREVHGDPAIVREFLARCGERGAHARSALAHGRLGQAHDLHARELRADPDLDLDGHPVDADQRGSANPGDLRHAELSSGPRSRGHTKDRRQDPGAGPCLQLLKSPSTEEGPTTEKWPRACRSVAEFSTNPGIVPGTGRTNAVRSADELD